MLRKFRIPRLSRRGGWLAAMLAAPLGLLAADDGLDQVSKVATEWVNTRSETIRLESAWEDERAVLDATVRTLEERVRVAEEDVALSKQKTARERGELETLASRNATAQERLAAAAERLRKLAADLQALRPGLPPRLSAALELPYRSLANPELPVGERMQYATLVLSRCLQFNHVVTTGDEALALPGEAAPKSLEVIYWGLSHAYALDRAAGKAWRGAPGPQGWQWQALPDGAADVSRLIAMATDRADPDFVLVPAQLTHPATR